MADKKNVKQKLTIAELIAKKEALAARHKETADIETVIGTVTIAMADKALVTEALEMGKDGGDEFLVYECVKEPNLKDAKLQEAFDCAEPIDVVEKIFKPGEAAALATLIMRHAGYENGNQMDFVKKADEAVKN